MGTEWEFKMALIIDLKGAPLLNGMWDKFNEVLMSRWLNLTVGVHTGGKGEGIPH